MGKKEESREDRTQRMIYNHAVADDERRIRALVSDMKRSNGLVPTNTMEATVTDPMQQDPHGDEWGWRAIDYQNWAMGHENAEWGRGNHIEMRSHPITNIYNRNPMNHFQAQRLFTRLNADGSHNSIFRQHYAIDPMEERERQQEDYFNAIRSLAKDAAGG